MRNCSPTPRSRRSTIRCPTNCTCRGPRRRWRPASTCCAKSRSRSTPSEARRLIAARDKSGKLVAEAFMVRHHPQWRRAREIVRSGAIGEVGAIQTLFSLSPARPRKRPQPAARRRRPLRHRLLRDPRRRATSSAPSRMRVAAALDIDPKFGTDRLASAILEFPGGRHLTFSAATQLAGAQRVIIAGTAGRIEVKIPFNAPPDRPTRDRRRQRRGSRRRRRARRGVRESATSTRCRATRSRAPCAARRRWSSRSRTRWPTWRSIDACFRAAKSGGGRRFRSARRSA